MYLKVGAGVKLLAGLMLQVYTMIASLYGNGFLKNHFPYISLKAFVTDGIQLGLWFETGIQHWNRFLFSLKQVWNCKWRRKKGSLIAETEVWMITVFNCLFHHIKSQIADIGFYKILLQWVRLNWIIVLRSSTVHRPPCSLTLLFFT